MLLADGAQRKEIIERQGAEGSHDAQRGKHDVVGRDVGQRYQHDAGIDAFQRADEGRDRKGDDDEAGGNSHPFPANPFLEATPQRGQ